MREGDKFASGDILADERIHTDNLLLLRIFRSKAVIVQEASIPPHIGVLCRMCGIPIIVHADIEKLSGKTVWISGLSGELGIKSAIDLPETGIPAWKSEYEKRQWQVSVCGEKQVAVLSKATFPLTFFIRHEFLWVGSSFNPFQCLASQEGEQDLEKRLYKQLSPYAAVMDRRHRFHFRSVDARVDEFENLQASPSHSKSEHGLALTLHYPKLLKIEMRVCQRIANDFGLSVVYSFPYLGRMRDLKRGLAMVREETTKVGMGAFVETPEFVHEIQVNKPHGLELFIGTKDLASNFSGYVRGAGESDHKNPLAHRQFRVLIERIADVARDCGQRCYYFCFLEHFDESVKVLPKSVGFSVCAYEFSLLSGIHLPHLYDEDGVSHK
jgi:hypothetical protein